ncbi:hypothetical protein MMC10_008255 [Thelotrema lepadinum]|nr:hypothetical protein [Thelotrema lepadinum]
MEDAIRELRRMPGVSEAQQRQINLGYMKKQEDLENGIHTMLFTEGMPSDLVDVDRAVYENLRLTNEPIPSQLIRPDVIGEGLHKQIRPAWETNPGASAEGQGHKHQAGTRGKPAGRKRAVHPISEELKAARLEQGRAAKIRLTETQRAKQRDAERTGVFREFGAPPRRINKMESEMTLDEYHEDRAAKRREHQATVKNRQIDEENLRLAQRGLPPKPHVKQNTDPYKPRAKYRPRGSSIRHLRQRDPVPRTQEHKATGEGTANVGNSTQGMQAASLHSAAPGQGAPRHTTTGAAAHTGGLQQPDPFAAPVYQQAKGSQMEQHQGYNMQSNQPGQHQGQNTPGYQTGQYQGYGTQGYASGQGQIAPSQQVQYPGSYYPQGQQVQGSQHAQGGRHAQGSQTGHHEWYGTQGYASGQGHIAPSQQVQYPTTGNQYGQYQGGQQAHGSHVGQQQHQEYGTHGYGFPQGHFASSQQAQHTPSQYLGYQHGQGGQHAQGSQSGGLISEGQRFDEARVRGDIAWKPAYEQHYGQGSWDRHGERYRRRGGGPIEHKSSSSPTSSGPASPYGRHSKASSSRYSSSPEPSRATSQARTARHSSAGLSSPERGRSRPPTSTAAGHSGSIRQASNSGRSTRRTGGLSRRIASRVRRQSGSSNRKKSSSGKGHFSLFKGGKKGRKK